MMLLVFLALVAWSAASVAFDVREDVMRTTYDYAPLNTSYLRSNMDMKLSNFDDKLEERTKDIGDILKSFEPDMFVNLEKFDKRDRLSLFNKVKVGVLKFPTRFTSKHLFHLRTLVAKLYETSPHVVDNAIFKVLEHKLETEHALASALVMNKDGKSKDQIVKKMLDYQVDQWVNAEKDEEEVFELLGLKDKNKNVFINPVFFQWIAFVKAKYPAKEIEKDDQSIITERAKKMFDVLAKLYEGDLTKVLVVGAQSNLLEAKNLAIRLLDFQVEEWDRDKIADRKFFDLLQLHKENGNPLESPVFFKWAQFIEERYSTKKKKYDAMLDKLLSHFKSKDALMGALDDAIKKKKKEKGKGALDDANEGGKSESASVGALDGANEGGESESALVGALDGASEGRKRKDALVGAIDGANKGRRSIFLVLQETLKKKSLKSLKPHNLDLEERPPAPALALPPAAAPLDAPLEASPEALPEALPEAPLEARPEALAEEEALPEAPLKASSEVPSEARLEARPKALAEAEARPEAPLSKLPVESFTLNELPSESLDSNELPAESLDSLELPPKKRKIIHDMSELPAKQQKGLDSNELPAESLDSLELPPKKRKITHDMSELPAKQQKGLDLNELPAESNTLNELPTESLDLNELPAESFDSVERLLAKRQKGLDSSELPAEGNTLNELPTESLDLNELPAESFDSVKRPLAKRQNGLDSSELPAEGNTLNELPTESLDLNELPAESFDSVERPLAKRQNGLDSSELPPPPEGFEAIPEST
ncbi:unnamed protein product [Peronospora farinosa]|uniref:Uncharacterized protein n=1 Tax=Peronospora farinosa TaxID=134698 RepID=A0AAV0SPS7_9STRA|nr:unnamed protein product [Peronospora farinosa]CAI5704089.1 unnamed protein product [Peronospora farinosa]